MTATTTQRRNALDGKRNTIIFYGGWYAVDNLTGYTVSAKSIEQALNVAEARNRSTQ